MTETYRIGPFVLDAEMGVLTEGPTAVPLGKRAVAVLAVLVRSASAYVSKARIMEAAWPGLVVEESNLTVQISSIRRALAPAGGEQWIETLSGRGYRFVGPVSADAGETGEAGVVTPLSNLSEPLTSFVGRERELAELTERVAANRLLTLMGAGGVGKTRLALRVAASVVGSYRDGTWLVELAPLSDSTLVPQAVATVLGLKEQPGKRLAETLSDYLRGRNLLLVLDNAEHLVAACAQFAEALLRQCPRVTMLVTSRERLGVPGESTYRVPSLSLPDPGRAATAQSLAEYESVRLFSERVRLHLPHFAVTDQNAAALANICRRLDGIALAIELAAARVRSMPVEEVNQRLDRRFALLTSGSRTVPHRQQTLRAAIDWSYDLLTEPEKATLARTSVFSGGWTLQAAEDVCTGNGIDASEVLDVLASLADKSLIVAEERHAATRYRFLETMQAYAALRLRETDGAAAQYYARHLSHYLALAEEAEPQLTGKDQQTWLDRLESEHDNIRFALARASEPGGDAVSGLRLAAAFSRFWLVRGFLAEGRSWLAKVLAVATDAEPTRRAKALNWAGVFAWKQGEYAAARALYEQCLTIRRALGDRRGIGAVLNNQGLLAYEQGDYAEARRLHAESLAIDRELGDRWGIAVSLVHLGSLAVAQGDDSAARKLYEESLAIFRECGDRGHIANALRSLGSLCNQQGDHSTARVLYDESLSICRDLGDRSGIAWATCGLGGVARHQGDLVGARSLFEESLAVFRDLGDREGIATALNKLGEIDSAEGDVGSARARQEDSLARFKALGDRSGIAASLEALARIAVAAGEPERASRLWGAIARLRDEIGMPRLPRERQEHERAVAAARAAAKDDVAFDAAWQSGRAMNTEEVIDYALLRAVRRTGGPEGA